MLNRWFAARGWEVVVLSRRRSPGQDMHRTVFWDGESLGDWRAELEGAIAVVNLSGRSVDCRYHRRNREQIMNSRVRSTRVLGKAIRQCENPPGAWLNSSTATIYRHSFDRKMDEWDGEIASTPEAKDAFSVQVAREWEQVFQECDVPRTRKVALRTAMVLGDDRGGVFHVLRRLTKLGLGGQMGKGRQFVSWIHQQDFCRAVEWLILKEDFCGVVNLVAPHPLPNSQMMRLFRNTADMRFGLPATRWMLELGAWLMRTETELIIKSRRVVPRRLLSSGFEFAFSEMSEAIQELELRLQGSNGANGIREMNEVKV